MGKRKSARKPPKKLKKTLDTTFSCLFCNHEACVSAKMEYDRGLGQLVCSSCGVSFQAVINKLDEPIDVYSKWIDACEEANSKANQKSETEHVDQQRPEDAHSDEDGFHVAPKQDADRRESDNAHRGSKRKAPSNQFDEEDEEEDDEDFDEEEEEY